MWRHVAHGAHAFALGESRGVSALRKTPLGGPSCSVEGRSLTRTGGRGTLAPLTSTASREKQSPYRPAGKRQFRRAAGEPENESHESRRASEVKIGGSLKGVRDGQDLLILIDRTHDVDPRR